MFKNRDHCSEIIQAKVELPDGTVIGTLKVCSGCNEVDWASYEPPHIHGFVPSDPADGEWVECSGCGDSHKHIEF